MGTKLSKSKILLTGFKDRSKKQRRSTFSPGRIQLDAAAFAWVNFQRSSSDGVLQLTDVLVDAIFVHRLLELSRNDPSPKPVQSLILCDCLFALSDPSTLVAFVEFLSMHSIHSFEFWDGEVPVEAKALDALVKILTESSAQSLRRLRVEASLVNVGHSMSHLLRSCSSLDYLEFIGCTLDMELVQDLSNHGFHEQSTLKQVILDSCCQVSDEMLTSLLRGLAKVHSLQHLQLSGNALVTSQSLPALTSFLRGHTNASTLQLSIHSNPNLFADCDDTQGRNFFEACLRSTSNKDLFLCQTGMNSIATACLFNVLERNETVERVDIRYNSFEHETYSDQESGSSTSSQMISPVDSDEESAQSWVKSLPRLQRLKTLHLPSNLRASNSFHKALEKNTSLTTCSCPARDYYEVRSKADILTRNKTLDLVRTILVNQRLSLKLYPCILNKIDKRISINGDVTALFQLVKGRSSEFGANKVQMSK